jgi:hypothetical protein
MSNQSENNFDIWLNEAPVVTIGKDGEFDIWHYEAPVEDVIESGAVTTIRRRIFIF